jgi:hypothetical protein
MLLISMTVMRPVCNLSANAYNQVFCKVMSLTLIGDSEQHLSHFNQAP